VLKNMIETGIVIPLYRTKIGDSETLRSLRNLNDAARQLITLILWDNSPLSLSLQQINELQGYFVKQIIYKHTPQNISLAKIYNQAIGMIGSCEAFVIFDQDSSFDLEYLQVAWVAFDENPSINLFVPMVRVDSIIVSPGDFQWFKGKYWKNERFGEIRAKNKVAIASGMFLRMSWLRGSKIRFNESLRLYNIDTDFMIRFATENNYFFVLPYRLTHDLSNFQEESIEKVLMRFRDFRRSIIVMSRGRGIGYLFLAVSYSSYLSLKKALLYRSTKFLF
jgi:GT2 family glycosyltransferase